MTLDHRIDESQGDSLPLSMNVCAYGQVGVLRSASAPTVGQPCSRWTFMLTWDILNTTQEMPVVIWVEVRYETGLSLICSSRLGHDSS